MELVRDIFEYAQSLAIDLCFQGFDEELAACPATMPSHAAHCCWPRWKARLLAAAHCAPDVRLPQRRRDEAPVRAQSLPGALAWGANWPRPCSTAPRQAGYACVLLDTLDDMESACALYADLGFEEIPLTKAPLLARTTSKWRSTE